MREQWRPPDRVRREHIEWWADHVERRMLGNARRAKGHKVGPAKPPWHRAQFLRKISHYPWADGLADEFGAAVDAAHGNPARFKDELGLRLGEPVTAGA